MDKKKTDFDVNVGNLLKDLMSDKDDDKAMSHINKVITKLLPGDDSTGNTCTKQKLRRYKSGATPIPFTTLVAVCEYLNIPMDEFVSRIYRKLGITNDNNFENLTRSSLSDGFENVIFNFTDNIDNLKKEYIQCIKDRKIKSKFGYYGEKVTSKYLDLIDSSDYQVHYETTRLLQTKQYLNQITLKATEQRKPLRVISFGIGNGKKDEILIRKLLRMTDECIEYWAFDISLDMIRVGVNNLRKELGDDFHKLDRRMHWLDFMDIDKIITSSSSNRQDKQNLFLLLGNTLGNFPEDDLLDKIQRVMKENDLLLVDNQIISEDVIHDNASFELYRNNLKAMYDTKKAESYIEAILEPANILSTDGYVITDIRTDRSDRMGLLQGKCAVIEHIFKFNKDKRTDDAFFTEGSSIEVAYSKKYTKTALIDILSKFFYIDQKKFCFYSDNDEYALILCRKEKNKP